MTRMFSRKGARSLTLKVFLRLAPHKQRPLKHPFIKTQTKVYGENRWQLPGWNYPSLVLCFSDVLTQLDQIRIVTYRNTHSVFLNSPNY